MDFISPEGVTFYGRKTLADCQAEHADAVLMDADEAYALYESRFREPVREVTEARYHDALNVLPPGKWTRIGGYEESFYVTERIAGNIVQWFVKSGARFFNLADEAGLIHSDIMPRVRVYIEDNPAAN